MHGRLKLRTTEEQAERKRIEREKKLAMYKAAMSACTSRIQTSHYDQTGLKVSEDILSSNGDIQTLWNFRKNIILHLHSVNETSEDEFLKIYAHELSLTETCLKRNPKSYCVWFQRQWCLLRANNEFNYSAKNALLSWSNELALCSLFLNADERNFHCWKHRYFVIENGKLSKEEELAFTYEKICANFSNYSAWHYRSKLIEQLYSEDEIRHEIFSKELALIENAVFTDPNDQSAWIYEKWFLLEHQKRLELDAEKMSKHLENVLELSRMEGERNKWCLLRLVELMCIVDFEKFREHVFDYLSRLASEIDPYRRNFYLDFKAKIEAKFIVSK